MLKCIIFIIIIIARVSTWTGKPGKWEGIFQSGNFEQTGKVGDNHTKYWKSRGISNFLLIFTARKRSLRRLCFHRCLSVHRGCVPLCMLGYAPRDQSLPPGNRHPPSQEQTPLQEQTHPRKSRHPPPPPPVHAGRYGQQAGGTHPTEMHTC